MAAGRDWVTGTSAARTDDALEDAKLMGIDLTDEDMEMSQGVWPWHLPALDAFRVVATQWRVSGTLERLYRTGLDYIACKAAWELAGTDLTPELFEDIQAIERGALAQMAKDAP